MRTYLQNKRAAARRAIVRGIEQRTNERDARVAAIRAENSRVVAGGVCPDCGRKLRRNLALTGWWQCSQFGAEQFRADAAQPSCDFQCFAE